jgi:hypothetical protein
MEHERKLASRDRMRLELEQAELSFCTFRPALSRGTDAILARKQRQQEDEQRAAVEAYAQARGDARLPPPPEAPDGADNTTNSHENSSSSSCSRVVGGSYLDRVVAAPAGASERLHSLAEQQRRGRQLQQRTEREAEMVDFPFQPNINPDTVAKFIDADSYKPIYERVGEVQRQRRRQLDRLREQRLREEREQNTFQPAIDPKSAAMAAVSRRQITRGIKWDDVDRGIGQGPSAGTTRSLDSPDGPGGGSAAGGTGTETATGDAHLTSAEFSRYIFGVDHVSDRLIWEGRQLTQKMQQLRQESLQAEEEAMRPAGPSRGTERLVKSSSALQASFSERAAHHQARVNTRRLERLSSRRHEEGGWFKPTLADRRVNERLLERRRDKENAGDADGANRSSSSSGGGDDGAQGQGPRAVAVTVEETPEERAMRLSVDDAVDRQQRRALLEQEVYGDLTFQPKIDRLSRALGRASDVEELYHNSRGRARKARAEAAERERIEQACTFKPDICAYPGPQQRAEEEEVAAARRLQHVGYADDSAEALFGPEPLLRPSHRSTFYRALDFSQPERLGSEIKAHLREKESARQSALHQREVSELRDCTFAPRLQDPPAPQSKLVVVRGLNRHLELQQLREKIKQERRTREDNAFRVKNVAHMRNTGDLSTKQEPFSLSTQAGRPSRAVLELRARDEAQLTFKPVTSDRAKRDYARGLARDSDSEATPAHAISSHAVPVATTSTTMTTATAMRGGATQQATSRPEGLYAQQLEEYMALLPGEGSSAPVSVQ